MRLTNPTRRTAALAGAAVLGVSGLAVLGISLSGGQQPTAVHGVVAEATTGAEPSAPPLPGEPEPAASTPAAHTTPSSSTHLLIPSVGLDLPLLEHTPKRGVINPPLLTAGYWIEPYGEPVSAADQATNTLYIAAHSAGRGDDGFDPLLADGDTDSTLSAGDLVTVQTASGAVDYTVERTQRYAKDELADAADVWEASPGRLVLITCFQRSDGRNTTENLVVFAES